MVRAAGRRIEWRRDEVDPFAFHLTQPPEAEQIEVDFQYLSPVGARAGARVMTPDIVTVPWQRVMLYPAGWFVRNIGVAARLKLPAGFRHASSLAVDAGAGAAAAAAGGGETSFAVTTLAELVDAPVFAGR